MKKPILMFIFVIIVFLLVFVFFAGRKTMQANKRTHVYSTVLALNAAIATEIEKGNPDVVTLFSLVTQQQRSLGSAEYDRLITILAKTHNFDAPKNKDPSMPLLDFWGNRYVLIVTKSSLGKYYVQVVSIGPDGIIGTTDDVSRD
ncbi:MAG: hypothetical protein KKG09_09315 [Verrucomicrobia bacterium]|nr:hypothetical protein [Verrucomicrobiota bacterium]MBU4291716.1 hypothetical protein [Verrucomicrobiota bacterium]MBU4498189.1 hypothetical protein [Verrucomicrobiota bacterium]MCG2681788.1 hypothetical protein [Kiritimatiellia bacterium]